MPRLVHGFFPRIRAWWRSTRRLGLFLDARKFGLTVEEARAAVDQRIPPTQEDLLYEAEKNLEVAARDEKRGRK